MIPTTLIMLRRRRSSIKAYVSRQSNVAKQHTVHQDGQSGLTSARKVTSFAKSFNKHDGSDK
ncbi:hypothetical protein AMECASPLE_013470, partial [Ameca splendens]